MTDQEAFDRMLAHLRAQGRRSVDTAKGGSVRCRYRGTDGGMCAVGCLIPDEDYSPTMERMGITALLAEAREGWMERDKQLRALEGLDPQMLSAMQRTHDCRTNWDDEQGFIGEAQARFIAEQYGLEYTGPSS